MIYKSNNSSSFGVLPENGSGFTIQGDSHLGCCSGCGLHGDKLGDKEENGSNYSCYSSSGYSAGNRNMTHEDLSIYDFGASETAAEAYVSLDGNTHLVLDSSENQKSEEEIEPAFPPGNNKDNHDGFAEDEGSEIDDDSEADNDRSQDTPDGGSSSPEEPRGSGITETDNGASEAEAPDKPEADEGTRDEEPEKELIYLVKNLHSSETYVCSYKGILEAGIRVVTPTRYGMDMGVLLGKMAADVSEINGDIYAIERIADEGDIKKFEQNREKELEAYRICREKIEKHQLEMKLVTAHYLLDEPKVLFFFTADSRVDFRDLVKDLVSVFRMRIELRQIGVRDESRVVGGIAVCGRQFCCHSITDKLNPVSIKMAKEQNLSLNSMKISGPCGRLLCCLSYEFDFYHEEKKKWPNEGNRLKVNGELCKIHEVNIISKKIYVHVGDGRMFPIPFEYLYQDEKTRYWQVDEKFLEDQED